MENNFPNKKKHFFCLSGLPRTGSTLLTAILSQNPKIHSEGYSVLSNIMFDTYISSTLNKPYLQILQANNRIKTIDDIISTIPFTYYKDIPEEETIIVDNSRIWTQPYYFQILKKYVDSNIKIIVLERPIIDIVKSLTKIHKQNDMVLDLVDLFAPISVTLVQPLNGIKWAKKNNENNNFLFIQYQELVETPQKVIEKIYEFCGWEAFEHSFENINVKYPINDEFYGIPGLHTIREKIEFLENDIELSQEVLDKIASLES